MKAVFVAVVFVFCSGGGAAFAANAIANTDGSLAGCPETIFVGKTPMVIGPPDKTLSEKKFLRDCAKAFRQA